MLTISKWPCFFTWLKSSIRLINWSESYLKILWIKIGCILHEVYYFFKFSVFHQFNGRFGPTSLAVSASNLLIASLFEFKSVVDEGCLGILNMEGDLVQKVKLSTIGPEISGLFLSRETD